jgi:uncharacterized protein DUF1707
MTRHQLVRASDADRDKVVDRLRDAAAEGRLEPDELEQRVDAALRARTYGELDWLVADLPGEAVTARRRLRVAPLLSVAAVVVVVMLVLAAVVLAAAWWMIWIAFWIVCRGMRRRRSAWHYPTASFSGRPGT